MIEFTVVDITLLSSRQKENNFYILKHPRMVKIVGKSRDKKIIEHLKEKLDGITTVIKIVTD